MILHDGSMGRGGASVIKSSSTCCSCIAHSRAQSKHTCRQRHDKHTRRQRYDAMEGEEVAHALSLSQPYHNCCVCVTSVGLSEAKQEDLRGGSTTRVAHHPFTSMSRTSMNMAIGPSTGATARLISKARTPDPARVHIAQSTAQQRPRGALQSACSVGGVSAKGNQRNERHAVGRTDKRVLLKNRGDDEVGKH